jgi:signal peptidase II
MLRDPAPFRGYVVDFLELPNWPVFNVADMALVGSAILAVILSLRGVDMGEAPQGEPPAVDPDGTAPERATDG